MKQIAGGIDRCEANAEFLELTAERIALLGVADRRNIEMWAGPRPPGADAESDIRHSALGAPGKEFAAAEPGQRVRVNPNPHAAAFLYAEIRNSTSRRAPSTVVCTGALPVAAAWKARSSSRNASS